LFAERRTVDLFNAVDIEGADREIDRFIERRHQEANAKANGEQRHIEDLWKESTRRERDKRRRENRALWYGHHEHMRELHSSPPPPITRQVGRRRVKAGGG
jgi:hypothetical protein